MNINKHGIKILLPHQPSIRKCFKIQHQTREAAFDHLVKMELEHGERGLEVYRCPFCKTFHIGHAGEVRS